MVMRTIAATSVWLAFAFSGSDAVAAVSCHDISTVDFRNLVIPAATYSGKPYYGGSFNGPGPGGPLRLRNGVFYQWDGGERDKNDRKPDWETSIQRDVLLHAAGSDAIRVIVLDQVHQTGTGSFMYVFAFQCDAGSLKKVFEGSGQGVKLERATANGMDITVGVWGDNDAHCCPGRQEHLRYRWVPSLKRFVRESSKAACPWLP